MFYDYEPTSIDDEVFISDIPLSLWKDIITSQFDNPLENRKKDYVKSFFTKYDNAIENTLEDDLPDLEQEREDFLRFMLDTFRQYLGIGFPEIDNMAEYDQNDLIHLSYRFFIKNIKKNFINVVLNYIHEHEEDIYNSYDEKNDVTATNFRYEVLDEKDIIILSNLGSIIQSILDHLYEDGDVDEFLHLVKTDEVVLETEFVSDKYDLIDITGNFVPQYVNMVDSEFKVEIESKVRNKILKKYPDRKGMKDFDNDDVESSDD